MTVGRLGLFVSAPENVERVNGILRSFAGGFNEMIARPSSRAWEGYCDAQPALLCPFAHEGAAMGYTLRRLFRHRPADFEADIVKPRPEMRYLHYVGLGFWAGMRKHDAGKLMRTVAGLDPLHGYLCYDGYGFKHAFFDYLAEPEVLRRLDLLEGYARNTAYHGVGRAFYFLFMDRPDLMIEHMNKLGEHAADAAAGAGLAAVFVNPDRLGMAQELGAALPQEWHDHYHLGMCFALKARSINDVDQFERDLARVSPSVREAAWASVRECDRIELQVRAEQCPDGYRRWRERVTQWMAGNIEYPLAAVKPSSPHAVGPRAVST
jgi:hypothetical protein